MKIIYFCIFLVFSSFFGFSQDVIIFKSGDELKVKILEIGVSDIKYKKADTTESNPIYQVFKSSVLMIRYSNGSKDIFNDEKNYHDTTINSSNEDLYIKGEKDATIYYKGFHGAGTGTFILTLLNPVLGLIPAIACSATPPHEVNLLAPNLDLMSKPAYRNGYTQSARQIKSGRVWSNWLVALLIDAAAALVYIYAL